MTDKKIFAYATVVTGWIIACMVCVTIWGCGGDDRTVLGDNWKILDEVDGEILPVDEDDEVDESEDPPLDSAEFVYIVGGGVIEQGYDPLDFFEYMVADVVVEVYLDGVLVEQVVTTDYGVWSTTLPSGAYTFRLAEWVGSQPEQYAYRLGGDEQTADWQNMLFQVSGLRTSQSYWADYSEPSGPFQNPAECYTAYQWAQWGCEDRCEDMYEDSDAFDRCYDQCQDLSHRADVNCDDEPIDIEEIGVEMMRGPQ